MVLASEQLDTHGLTAKGWTVKYDGAKTRAGCCFYDTKVISFSRHFAEDAVTTDAEFMDTVLHEIAHALVGHAVGHGPVWKQKAVDIGCSGEVLLPRRISRGTMRIECPCGHVCVERHVVQRKMLLRICSVCRQHLTTRILIDLS